MVRQLKYVGVSGAILLAMLCNGECPRSGAIRRYRWKACNLCFGFELYGIPNILFKFLHFFFFAGTFIDMITAFQTFIVFGLGSDSDSIICSN